MVDLVAVAANEAGALEDVEDVPPFMALEARPRRRRSCGDIAGEKFPPTACGDGGRSSAVAAHRGCRASHGGGGWLEQQVVERKRERGEMHRGEEKGVRGF